MNAARVRRRSAGRRWALAAGVAFAGAGIPCAMMAGAIPANAPLAIYAAVSAATYFAYLFDKARAVARRRRIPETTLHLLELLGGWPGALLAQRVLRHKNSKPSYQLVYWLIVAVHGAAWGWVWMRGGGGG